MPKSGLVLIVFLLSALCLAQGVGAERPVLPAQAHDSVQTYGYTEYVDYLSPPVDQPRMLVAMPTGTGVPFDNVGAYPIPPTAAPTRWTVSRLPLILKLWCWPEQPTPTPTMTPTSTATPTPTATSVSVCSPTPDAYP